MKRKVKGKGEKMNALQIEELYEEIDKAITVKKRYMEDIRQRGDDLFVVFFGANKLSELGIEYLHGKGIKVSGIIDNGKDKVGMTKCGVEVFTPEMLLTQYRENAVIFIASRYVKPMTEQLVNMGYKRDIHIFETIYHIPTPDKEEFENAICKVREGEKVYEMLYTDEAETLILCPYKGIGDIYFIGAYLKEYCRRKNIDRYKLAVVGGSCKRIAEMFGIEHITVISQREMDRVIKYVSFVGTGKLNVIILNHNYTYFNILSPFEVKGKISWGKMFLCGIMEFGENDNIKALKPKRRKVNMADYGEIVKDKTVIFAPYANTVSNVSADVWQMLADKLKESGYEVFTNSAGSSEPVIKGTKGLSAPLEDMAEIVEYAGIFIGIRSGMCDLVAGTKAKKIILYPDKSSEFFKMEDMGISENTTEIYLQKYEINRLNEFIQKEIYDIIE